jgi:hypothetical protein
MSSNSNGRGNGRNPRWHGKDNGVGKPKPSAAKAKQSAEQTLEDAILRSPSLTKVDKVCMLTHEPNNFPVWKAQFERHFGTAHPAYGGFIKSGHAVTIPLTEEPAADATPWEVMAQQERLKLCIRKQGLKENEDKVMHAEIWGNMSFESQQRVSRQADFTAFSAAKDPHRLFQAVVTTHAAPDETVPAVRKMAGNSLWNAFYMKPHYTLEDQNMLWAVHYQNREAAGCDAFTPADAAAEYIAKLDPQRYASFKTECINDANKGVLAYPATLHEAQTRARDYVVSVKSAVDGSIRCLAPPISADLALSLFAPSGDKGKGPRKWHDKGKPNAAAGKNSKSEQKQAAGGPSGKGGSGTESKQHADGKKKWWTCNFCQGSAKDDHKTPDCPNAMLARDAARRANESSSAETSLFTGAFCLIIKDEQLQDDVPSTQAHAPTPTCFSKEVLALVSKAAGRLGEDELVLDCASSVSGVRNHAMLTDIIPAQRRLIVSGVGHGGLQPGLQGTLGSFGLAYACVPGESQFPANILGLNSAEEAGCVAEYITGQPFRLTDRTGRRHDFEKSPTTGLFTKTFISGTDAISLTNTVSENQAALTPSQLRRADEAVRFMAKLGYPNFSAAAALLNKGVFVNCDVTTEAIWDAWRTYGKPIAFEKGVRHAVHAPKPGVPEPTDAVVLREQRLYADLIFVEKQIFLLTISKPMDYMTATPLANKSAVAFGQALLNVISEYKSRRFRVPSVSIDGESAAAAIAPQIEAIGTCVDRRKDHVEIIERAAQTVKTTVRKIKYGLAIKLFGVMLLFCVLYAVQRINLFPRASSGSCTAPREAFTGIKSDWKKLGRTAFGDLVIVRDTTGPTKNDMSQRAAYGVVMKFVGNAAEDVVVLNLATGRTRNRAVRPSDIQPWPQHLIDLIAASCKAGADGDPLFETAHGVTADEEDGGAALDGADTEDSAAPGDDAAPMATPSARETMPAGAHGVNGDIQSPLYGGFTPPALVQVVPASEPLPAGYQAVLTAVPMEALPGRGVDELELEQQGPVQDPDAGAYVSDTGMHATTDPPENQQSPPAPPIAGVRHPPPRPRGQYSLRNREVDLSFHISVNKGLREYGQDGLVAMFKEIQQIDQKGSFIGVKASDLSKEQLRRAIRSQLFFKAKYLPNGEFDKLKARLVAGGHMQDRELYDDVSSPTATTESIMMVATIAAKQRRYVITVDVGAAFLQSKLPDDGPEIIMKLDKTVAAALAFLNQAYDQFVGDDGCIYVRLSRALYGCLESAKLWYQNLRLTLEDAGFVANAHDCCVFNKGTAQDQITVCIHVDDMLITAHRLARITALLDTLRAKYRELSVHDERVLAYLGMEFDFTCVGKVKLTQYGYVEEFLGEYGVTGVAVTPAANSLFDTDESSAPLDELKAAELHSRVAKVLYLAKRTRPDLLTAIAFLSTRVLTPTQQDWHKMDRVLAYINATRTMGLCLSADEHVIRVIAHVDASYGVHVDMKSHTGAAISLGGGAFHSKSSKQKIATKSSTEAELVGLSDSASMVIWVRNFLCAQGFDVPPATICQDNQSTMALVHKGRSTANRTRHIAIRFFWVKDRVDSGELAVEYLPTGDMVADMLTKPLQGEQFMRLRALLLGWDEV